VTVYLGPALYFPTSYILAKSLFIYNLSILSLGAVPKPYNGLVFNVDIFIIPNDVFKFFGSSCIYYSLNVLSILSWVIIYYNLISND